jgi:hypothetical protein
MSSTTFSLEGRFGDFSTVVLRATDRNPLIEEPFVTVPSHHACHASVNAHARANPTAKSRCDDGFVDAFDDDVFTCTTEKGSLQLSDEAPPDALIALRTVICK